MTSAQNSSYTKKAIAITVLLDGQQEATFSGFACSVSISKSGCPSFPKAAVSLKGLSLDTMGRLTHLGFKAFSLKRNKIRIEAGIQDETLSTIFQGEIASAWADFNAAPSPEFKIEARTGLFAAMTPQSPISVKGNQTVASIIDTIAKETGYVLENNEITASIKDCVINGDPVTKMRRIADAVGANLLFDDDRVVLVDRNAARKNEGETPLINATNGMVGYPTFSNTGMSVSCFFRPELRIGSSVKVESIVPHASGTWKIVGLKHDLSAYDPGRQSWKTSIECVWPRW